jgi:hypothetical protein
MDATMPETKTAVAKALFGSEQNLADAAGAPRSGPAEVKAYAAAGQALVLMGFVPAYSWFALTRSTR